MVDGLKLIKRGQGTHLKLLLEKSLCRKPVNEVSYTWSACLTLEEYEEFQVEYYDEALHNEEGDDIEEGEAEDECPERPQSKTYVPLTSYMDTYLTKLIAETERLWLSDSTMNILGQLDQTSLPLDIWNLPQAKEQQIINAFR